MFTRIRLGAMGVSLALAVPALAHAQSQSMEERLRTQLRSTTQQLQSLQSQQAQVNAAKVAAEAQRDAAQKEVERLRGQLEKVTGQAQKLAEQQDAVEQAARAQVAASYAQRDQFKNAYDELLTMARATEANRVSLQKTLAQRDGELTLCAAKNRELYDAGKEILAAYENFSTGDLLKIRQPFAAGARVKFEEQAQEYGDKLYGGQFDPRQAVQSPAVAADAQS
ncbi:DNA repair protein [Bordetella petrii]|nr:DNA repair protein [Bordetella petrii]